LFRANPKENINIIVLCEWRAVWAKVMAKSVNFIDKYVGINKFNTYPIREKAVIPANAGIQGFFGGN
jgi:hypothetical protein